MHLLIFIFQVCEEFARITAIPLRSTFYQKLDQHTPKLMRLFEKKGGVHGNRISGVLDKLKEVCTWWGKREQFDKLPARHLLE